MTSAPLERLDTGGPPPRATRRTVVVAGGVAVAVIGVPTSLRLLPGLGGAAAGAPRTLDRAAFAPHLGRTFDARLDGASHRLELEEVGDLDGLPGDPDSFVLRFRADDALEQGTYEVSRTGFAASPVFLVPGQHGEAPRLTAIFNRVQAAPR